MKPRLDALIASVLGAVLLAPALLAAQAPAVPGAAADYVVGARDVLHITSYDDADLSGQFTVETDGTFTFPMLGRVTAGGLTLRAVEASLKHDLVARGFYRNPQITVSIDQYRSQKIFVLGEVRNPGVYPLSTTMRLVEALALADSTLPTAGCDVVIMSASTDPSDRRAGRPRVVRVNLDDLQSGNVSLNVALKDGDTILVPRAEDVYVFGQVRTPGAYPLRVRDMTVLQALSMAGGLTDRGATGRIEIIRIVEGEKVNVNAELTDTVQPGDTIVVPERFF
ncbi:MAG: SLBB domain-containing protein [Acidobacteria bacterium]|nr:SLBB domain-containing protein [Acidobacteriota bacterium]